MKKHSRQIKGHRGEHSSARQPAPAWASPQASLTCCSPLRRRRAGGWCRRSGSDARQRPDPHDGRAQHGRERGVDQERPRRAGRQHGAASPPNTRVIDLRGRTVVPGLIEPTSTSSASPTAPATTPSSRTRRRSTRCRRRWPRAARACPRASGSRRWAAGIRTSGPSIATRR